ncbi:MAG: amidase [Phenylobacterium sp.]|nr:amidase [Phenylobacterium sp.]
MADFLDRDATDQLAALRSGDISARELLLAAVERAERTADVNAVVSRDVERALREAKLVDEKRARGDEVGMLAGLPMTVKDTLDVEGLPGSAGLKTLLNRKAVDACVVERVRKAGAIVWGKTNTPANAGDWQTYNALYGVTNNPLDQTRTPGGSSGGSAAALAAGITALEIGADIAGSLRIPASYCGVFAHKPTFGVISQRGLVPPAVRAADIDLAVVGPMARSARDLQLLYNTIADHPDATRKRATLRTLRVGLWIDEPAFVLDHPVHDTIRAFAERLSAAGSVVSPISAPVPPGVLLSTYTMLLFAIMGASVPPLAGVLFEALRGPARVATAMGASPMSWAQGVLGYAARHRDWLAANETRAHLRGEMITFFQRYDILICPCAPTVAFPHDHRPINWRTLSTSTGDRFSYLRTLEWSALATTCGLPATAIPAGLAASGLPVGVQIIGPPGSDTFVIAVAEAIEKALQAA